MTALELFRTAYVPSAKVGTPPPKISKLQGGIKSACPLSLAKAQAAMMPQWWPLIARESLDVAKAIAMNALQCIGHLLQRNACQVALVQVRLQPYHVLRASKT